MYRYKLSNDTDQTLDPVDWETLRALGHRMVDDAMECLQTVSVRLEHPDDLIADLLQALEG